ncbi:MAG: thiolase family protein, partial [Actinobacteria bacterium]|nr:thiolase family protein [Actinomycetota bacterium]MBU1944354.1 thiolase family protein [Actinomycetota bacterium]MBU2686395.1 thiolase family protein [Actinomycetota bacterium]
MNRKVAIVGVGMTPMKSRWPDRTRNELAGMATREALDDAGITIRDVDEVVLADIDFFTGVNNSIMWLADDVGAYMKPVVKYETGGTVGGSACHAAVHHVAAGLSDVVLCSATMKPPSIPADMDIPMGAAVQAALTAGFHPIWERFSSIGAIGIFAVLAASYIAQSGCTEEAAALCRVKAANNSIRNERSHLKMPLTVEAVTESPLLVWPLRLMHMCPMTQGSASIIFASEEAARKITDKPVWVRDIVNIHSAQFYTTSMLVSSDNPMNAPASLPSLVKASEVLYRRNGITDPVRDIDVIEMYDPSTWAELI